MPRDSGGIYTLPSGYLAVTGQNILPANHNPPLEDIATALTNSLPRNGAAAMTGNLQMGTNKVTGIADATADTDVPSFKQAKGALVSGTVTAQASLSLNLSTYVTAGYKRVIVNLYNITPSVAGEALAMGLSADGGSTGLTGLTQQVEAYWSDAGFVAGNESDFGSTEALIYALAGTGAPSSAVISLTLGASNSFWIFSCQSYFQTVGSGNTRGSGQVAGVVNALLFEFSAGNIATAAYDVYGFR